MGYFDGNPSEYTYKAFDIETTGFAASDTLTTLTLESDGLYRIWVNGESGDVDYDAVTEEIEQESGENIRLLVAENAEDLLTSVRAFVEENFDAQDILVAYNGETWNSGFDLQFLRTACLQNGVEWVFKGVRYLDIYPVFGKKNRFNTEVPSHKGLNKAPMQEFAEWIGAEWDDDMGKDALKDAIAKTQYDFKKVSEWCAETGREEIPTYDYSDQVGVYQALTDTVHTYDPWANSKNAVIAFEEGTYAPLALHNLADVVKTKELTDLAVNYVSKDDLSLKRL